MKEKKNIDILDFRIIKDLGFLKDTVKGKKRQTTDWEKNVKNVYIWCLIKNLFPEWTDNSQQLFKIEKTTRFKNGPRFEWKLHQKRHVVNKCVKRCSTSLVPYASLAQTWLQSGACTRLLSATAPSGLARLWSAHTSDGSQVSPVCTASSSVNAPFPMVTKAGTLP